MKILRIKLSSLPAQAPGSAKAWQRCFWRKAAKVVGCGIEPEMKIQDSSAIYVQADLTKI